MHYAPGGQSDATVAATDEAAKANALRGLAAQQAMDAEAMASPITPIHRIRRSNTAPRLSDVVAEQSILDKGQSEKDLGTGGNSTQSPETPSTGNTPKKSTRKGKKCNGKKKSKKTPKSQPASSQQEVPVPNLVVPNATAEKRDSLPAPPTPATDATQLYIAPMQPHKATAAKRAAKPSAKPPPAPPLTLVKPEVKTEPPSLPGLATTTPTSVRRQVAVQKSQEQNHMNRAESHQQLGKSPPPPQAEPIGSDPCEDEEFPLPDDESFSNPSEFGDWLDQATHDENTDSEQEDQELPETEQPPPQKSAGSKKKKKAKTPEQKAMHARYMRFSRSLRSTLSANMYLLYTVRHVDFACILKHSHHSACKGLPIHQEPKYLVYYELILYILYMSHHVLACRLLGRDLPNNVQHIRERQLYV